MIPHDRKILVDKLNVRPGFLDTTKGSMFTEEAPWLQDDGGGAKYLNKDQLIARQEEEIRHLKDQVTMLKEQLKATTELSDARKEQIDMLKRIQGNGSSRKKN